MSILDRIELFILNMVRAVITGGATYLSYKFTLYCYGQSQRPEHVFNSSSELLLYEYGTYVTGFFTIILGICVLGYIYMAIVGDDL